MLAPKSPAWRSFSSSRNAASSDFQRARAVPRQVFELERVAAAHPAKGEPQVVSDGDEADLVDVGVVAVGVIHQEQSIRSRVGPADQAAANILVAASTGVQPELADHLETGDIGMKCADLEIFLAGEAQVSQPETQVFAGGQLVLGVQIAARCGQLQSVPSRGQTKVRVVRCGSAEPVPGRRCVSPVPRPRTSSTVPRAGLAKSRFTVRATRTGGGRMART